MNEQQIQQNFDTLAKYFGFSQDELANLLYVNDAFIAGSAALNVFIQTELFKDLDLNIFLHNSNEVLATYQFSNVLESKGYKCIDQVTNGFSDTNVCSDTYIEPINIITYINANLKKIQIITISDCSIKNFMDNIYLNICRLAIIGSNHKLQFYMDHLTDKEISEIKHKTMYIYHLSKDYVVENLFHLENLCLKIW
jgi:hypothetical protein